MEDNSIDSTGDKSTVLAKTFLKGSLLILPWATMKTSVIKVIVVLQTQ